MLTLAILVLCIQACLVQNVYCQCGLNTGFYGSSPGQGFGSGIGLDSCTSSAYGPVGGNSQLDAIIGEGEGYGGTGVGEVLVNGIVPVKGYSSISGQVPILGVVRFDGPVAAKGSVSISGACGCRCQ